MDAKILIVEDEAGIVKALQDRLRKEGYTVNSARDGAAGLELAANSPYDLIILDLMLPKQSGLTVCQKLRQSGSTTPILMLTARRQTMDKVVGLRTGADDYLTKPFQMAELLARVDALLRRAGSQTSAPPLARYQFGLYASIYAAPRFPSTVRLSICPPGNSSFSGILSSIAAPLFHVRSSFARSGATMPFPLRELWMYTSRGSDKKSKQT